MIPAVWPPPALPAPPRPRSGRLSMTLMQREDDCPRSAYLDLATGGGAPSHDMARGTLLHRFAQRAMETLIEHGEQRLEPEQAADHSAVIVDELVREDPGLVVPQRDVDAVREMAYHWSVGLDVDPEQVVCLEQRFVLEVAGQVVVGKPDVVWLAGEVLCVDDYKTSFHMTPQEQVEDSFQLQTYMALVAFGRPVVREKCERCASLGVLHTGQVRVRRTGEVIDTVSPCHECDGRGYVETLLDPIGDRVQWFRGREVWPRYLGDDGLMRSSRPVVRSRTQLRDFLADLETKVVRFESRFESGDWPAVPGVESHCKRCPAPAACPLPRVLRRHAGTVNSFEEAQEALTLIEMRDQEKRATLKEVREWAKRGGPVPVGADVIYDWSESSSQTVDRDALLEAVERTVETGLDGGERFDPERYVRRGVSTGFRRRKRRPGEE